MFSYHIFHKVKYSYETVILLDNPAFSAFVHKKYMRKKLFIWKKCQTFVFQKREYLKCPIVAQTLTS